MNLEWKNVLTKIKYALDNQQPFSMVRIGDGENIVMAQKSVWRLSSVLREPWAKKANRGQKGVRLPNLKLRDQMVQSIKKADIVGILPPGDRRTYAPGRLKRPLTNKIFRYYRLKPRYTCDAVVNRFFAGRKEFWDVLRGRRVLLVTRHAERLKKVLQSKPYMMDIAGTIVFTNNNQMSHALQQVNEMKDNFDVALISCGVNTVVLAPEIALSTGKVAIDFGKGHHAVFKNKITKSTEYRYKKVFNETKHSKNARAPQYVSDMISIVIVSHNSLKLLKDCIESIQQYSPLNIQLVLVDNGSTDGTAEYIRSIPGATVIVNKITKRRSEAMNHGVIASKGEYIVLLNENTAVTKDWLPGMLRWLQLDPAIGVVGVGTNSEKSSRQGYKADALNDTCLMFHSDLAVQIGIFDERLNLPHSLGDFFIRSMIAGKKLWVANNVVIHRFRTASVPNNRQFDNKTKLVEKWNISRWENFAGIAHREKPFDQNKHYYP